VCKNKKAYSIIKDISEKSRKIRDKVTFIGKKPHFTDLWYHLHDGINYFWNNNKI